MVPQRIPEKMREAATTSHTYAALALACVGAFFAIDLLAQFNQYIVPDTAYFQGLKDQEALVTDSLKTLLQDTSLIALLANAVVMVLVPAFGEEFFSVVYFKSCFKEALAFAVRSWQVQLVLRLHTNSL